MNLSTQWAPLVNLASAIELLIEPSTLEASDKDAYVEEANHFVRLWFRVMGPETRQRVVSAIKALAEQEIVR